MLRPVRTNSGSSNSVRRRDSAALMAGPAEDARRIVGFLRLSDADRHRLLTETREEMRRMEEFMKPDASSQRAVAAG